MTIVWFILTHAIIGTVVGTFVGRYYNRKIVELHAQFEEERKELILASCEFALGIDPETGERIVQD